MSNSDNGDTFLQLLEMMTQQHQDVMQTLSEQSTMLKELCRKPQVQVQTLSGHSGVQGPMREVPTSIPETNVTTDPANQIFTRTTSAKNLARSITLGTGSMGSGRSARSGGSGMPDLRGLNSPAIQRSPGESLAPSLFTSYSREDMMMKLDASRADSALVSVMGDAMEDREQSCLQRLTRHVAFDIFFGVVVVTNAIFIGIDVQTSLGETKPPSVGMEAVRYFYTLAFTIELFLRLIAEGCRPLRSDDCLWNLFDGLIVIAAWLEVGIDIAQLFFHENSEVEGIAGISSLRAFRIIRLTRILKTAQVIRVLRFVMALRTLVTSIMSTLKALFWALLLLFLIIYIFALLFTQAFDEFFKDGRADELSALELSQSDKYFGTLFHSMLSLFMSIAGGVSWEDVIAPLMKISTVWLLGFLFYVAFTYFAAPLFRMRSVLFRFHPQLSQGHILV